MLLRKSLCDWKTMSSSNIVAQRSLQSGLWIGFSLVIWEWRRLVVCRGHCWQWKQFNWCLILCQHDWGFSLSAFPWLCVFTDIFNLMDTQHTHSHTHSWALEVTSWITSFGLCCIITSSAVISSDVPTGMRQFVLHCSHTHTHDSVFASTILLCVILEE